MKARGYDKSAALAHRRATDSASTIDMLSIVSASQVLSSETAFDGLQARVAEVLSAMTGATGVHLLLWSDEQQGWLTPAGGDGQSVPPMSVLRYVQRTRQPLVVEDALCDERFAGDPYFTNLTCCSVSAVPIFRRGALEAVLVLENCHTRGAFTTERLEEVELITGQLAVSVDNAHLYSRFHRIADDQAALRRVATLVARGVEPSQVFGAVTDEARRCLRMKTAGLWRFEANDEITLLSAAADPELRAKWPVGTRTPVHGDNLAMAVLSTSQPARMNDYEKAAGPIAARVRAVGVRATIGVPIIVGGQVWGLMAVGSVTPGPIPADAEARMSDFTELVSTAIANAATRQELQASNARLAVLAMQQAALRRVATLVARSASPSEVFEAVSDELARVLHVVNAGLLRYDADGTGFVVAVHYEPGVTGMPVAGDRIPLAGDDVGARVLRTGRAARIDNHAGVEGPEAERIRTAGIGSIVGVPVIVDGRLWGAAIVGSRGPEPMPPDTEARIGDFAELVATSIVAAAIRDELVKSRGRIVAAADETRRRLERNLHDGAQQRAVSLGLQLSLAQRLVPADLPELTEKLSEVDSALTGLSDELREISHGLHPAELAEAGLGSAVKRLARRSTLPVTLDIASPRELPETVAVAAYYVVAESLTNAAKHARASAVTVRIRAVAGSLNLTVDDNGVGGADFANGSGLIGLKDRVEALGGQLVMSSPAGKGTSLNAAIPLHQP